MFSSDSTQKRKLNISMMLKVPIDLELEVLGVPPVNNHHTEETTDNPEIFNFTGVSEPEVIVNRAQLDELDENSLALVTQLVGQLQQKSQTFSTLLTTPSQSDYLVNDEQDIVKNGDYIDNFSSKDLTESELLFLPKNTKNKMQLMDYFNDSFAFVINAMATVLFLGKLANYSWD
ncbi:hypothetical protein HCG51_03260 [Tolypothrix sp. PCC 7910]|uniref:hypothetical protein n=1 Tax=Tolypothrix sp. PCC 7910 TaxID=2099387 RepID=UPI0014279FAD|nr:hypothetical protein [Tolypothrix sp. PCC 7910]QIR35870.1 hypothetical protein HCG51_03260 [Tolypothrix sp. PCC 7910]